MAGLSVEQIFERFSLTNLQTSTGTESTIKRLFKFCTNALTNFLDIIKEFPLAFIEHVVFNF
ncbi:MAG: hypothetical protein LBB53_04020 [Prevotellaceae bacterium]|nr:hypothetical protein [Prevotellaceae bacterium]